MGHPTDALGVPPVIAPGTCGRAAQRVVKAMGLALLALWPAGAGAHEGPHRTGGSPPAVSQQAAPFRAMRPDPAGRARVNLMVHDLAAAVEQLAASLDATQRSRLFFPLDAPQRTPSRDPSQTPSFCAVLAWCVPGWGLEVAALSFQQRMAFEAMLGSALGSGGYEIVSMIRNRQQLIGRLEDQASPSLVDAATRLFPDRRFATIDDLVAAMRAAGAEPEPQALQRPTIGGMNPGAETWSWYPPGSAERWRQFEGLAVAVFGRPRDRVWALRIEAHHLSLNLTMLRDGADWQVHGTPLFLGFFPVVVPASTDGTLSDPLTWQRGQSSGLGLIRNIRAFWLEIPERQRRAAWRQPGGFPQRAPLENETPNAVMIAALEPKPDTAALARGPHIVLPVAQLPPVARTRLSASLDELLSTLHPAVSAVYRRRISAALQDGRIIATWAGGDLAEPGSQHFSAIAIGPFLVELLQTPQYSVAPPEAPWANHLHVMLRDMRSPVWSDPLRAHLATHEAPGAR